MPDDYGPGDHVTVTVDPARNGGSPSLSRRMVPLPAVLGQLLAGEPLDTVRDEYDLTDAEGRVVEALAELVRELSGPVAAPTEPAPELVRDVLLRAAAYPREWAALNREAAGIYFGAEDVEWAQGLAAAQTKAAHLIEDLATGLAGNVAEGGNDA